MRQSTYISRLLLSSALALACALPAIAQDARTYDGPIPPRDQKVELALKIKDDFTVVAVGDLIQMAPFADRANPDTAHLVNLMRSADVTLANNENIVVDFDTYRGPNARQLAPDVVADDWARMGIDMVTKANNHTWDVGEDGLWANFKELKRVRIVHVGVDRNESEARMTRSFSTPKGSVGLMGMDAKGESTSRMSGVARDEPIIVTPAQLEQVRAMRDAIVARRGETNSPIAVPENLANEVTVFSTVFQRQNATDGLGKEHAFNANQRRQKADGGKVTSRSSELKLVTYNGVTAPQLAQLRAIAGNTGTGDTLEAFGTRFKVMPGVGEFDYEMDPQSLRNILREVRTGKQFNDLLAVTIHWHQNRFAFQRYSNDHYPPAFQTAFAHAAIDQGADLFFAHGVHTLKGVEIYKGKPIFYGLSNFVYQSQLMRPWRDEAEQPQSALDGPVVGDGELAEKYFGRLQQRQNQVALLTETKYEKGRLAEVRLHPVDLGDVNIPGSQYGTPRRPTPDVARQILEDVIEYSRPFKTDIRIEKGVGVIRLPAQRGE